MRAPGDPEQRVLGTLGKQPVKGSAGGKFWNVRCGLTWLRASAMTAGSDDDRTAAVADIGLFGLSGHLMAERRQPGSKVDEVVAKHPLAPARYGPDRGHPCGLLDHPGGDGVTLGVVAFEELWRCRAPHGDRKLPAEVECILHPPVFMPWPPAGLCT